MKPFSYARPSTSAEAVQAFATAGAGARYIAGGTTLYDLMKLDIERPQHLIDVTAIRGMDAIDTGGDQLRFGALAPMSVVASDPFVIRDYPLLAEALWKAASQQLRNMATVGGNLLQRTRCLYFRNGSGNPSSVGVFPCNKLTRVAAARRSAASTAARRSWATAMPAPPFRQATGRWPSSRWMPSSS